MNTKYIIIGVMYMLFLNCVGFDAAGSSSDRTSGGPVAAHHVATTEADIAAVEEEPEEHRLIRQAAEAHAEGLRAEAVKAERIRELRAAGNTYLTAGVRIGLSGREDGYIINQQGMLIYKGQQLIMLGGMVPVMTENGLKIGKLFLPGIASAIKNTDEITNRNGEFITPEVSIVLQDMPMLYPFTVTHEELFIILLLLQTNGFRPCQKFVENYPFAEGRYDDFTSTDQLAKKGAKFNDIKKLIKEAAEFSHRNGKSLGIVKNHLERLLAWLCTELKYVPSVEYLKTSKELIDKYIEELEELNAFSRLDDERVFFAPE